MVAFVASPFSTLARTAIKTLDFFVSFLNIDRRSHTTTSAASAAVDDISSGDVLLSRFLHISKKFSKPNPSHDPPKFQQPHRLIEYQSLMTSFNQSSQPHEVLRLFQQLKGSIFFRTNLFIYTTVIEALASLNRYQEAEALFKEAIDSGMVPDAAFCTVLVKMYSFYMKDFSLAHAMIGYMIQCGILPDVITYSTLITGLCRASKVDEARHVLLLEMKRANCEPNLVCYSMIFDALVSGRRYHEAGSLFLDMIESGIMPDVVLCTNLVKMYSIELGDFVSAREVIRAMVGKWGCEPDVVTYSTLINGLCRAGRVEEAREVVDEMLGAKCMPNCQTFTPMLEVYCSDGRIGEAKRLLDWMESVNLSPDTMCYNVLIHGLCEKGDFDEVENVLREGLSKGWEPDVVSYNSYIRGLCKVGRTEEALRQLEVMLGKGLCPTVVSLNILLDSLCRESGVQEVKHLLERSSELGLDVDTVSYNTVMNRLCEVEEWLSILKLFTDMVKKGIEPDTRSFNILIYGLCKAGKFRMAKCLFDSKGFVPDVVTCNILMHQYLLAGKKNELNHLISYMMMNNIAHDKVTCNIGVQSLCRDGRFSEAIDFVKGLEDVYSQEVIAHLTNGLVKGGRLGDLLRLFEEMLDKGLVLDCQVYDFLISAFCKKGSCDNKEIYKLCLILEKMLGI